MVFRLRPIGLTLLLSFVVYAACSPVERPYGPLTDDDSTGGNAGESNGDGDNGDGDGDGGGTGGGDGDGDGTGGGDGDGDGDGDDSSCVDVAMGENLTATASTQAAANDHTLSCVTGNAPDVVFEWTAPYDDYFTVSTEGSSFDTVVGVFTGGCGAPVEVACNDNFRSDPQGQAQFKATQGETYLIIVDGNSGGKGDVSLELSPVTCPSSDLSGQPVPATLSTVGAPNDAVLTCNGTSDTPEKTVRYVAEESGLYNFRATSSEFGPQIYLHRGVICGGQLLQCNANVGANPADISRYLEAGEGVTITVQGGEGEFSLDIQKLPETALGCSDLPILGAMESGTISSADGRDELTPSCAWSGNAAGHYREHAYRFQVDLAGAFASCYINVQLEGAGTAFLIDGDNCSEPELECVANQSDTDFNFSGPLKAWKTLVIDNADPFQSNITYTITNGCAP